MEPDKNYVFLICVINISFLSAQVVEVELNLAIVTPELRDTGYALTLAIKKILLEVAKSNSV